MKALVLLACLFLAHGLRILPHINQGMQQNLLYRARMPSNSPTKVYLFDRIVRVITSNVNNLIKSMEDPEKIIEQAVIDMQNDLIKIRQSYAEVSATQKRMEKQLEQAQSAAADWYRRAQLALQKV
jgi:phage shock protein A